VKVFVSSVVKDFEEFRSAARRAIETLDHAPMMSEDFGARPYSAERACITELEASDVVVLILGERYGYEHSEGESVTQQEFRRAISLAKKVLVFIQDVDMEPKQSSFRQEVESYHSGFCRELFSTPEDLNHKIIQNLNRLGRRVSASISAEEFEQMIAGSVDSRDAWNMRSDSARFSFAFLPQPLLDLDPRELVGRRDDFFTKMCRAGLANLRSGYEPIDGRDHSGLKSGDAIVRQFENGLIRVETDASARSSRVSFSSWYVPPSRIRELGAACFQLTDANGGWCRIGLTGMEHAVVTELPATPTSSFSLASRGEIGGFQDKLLIPYTESAYLDWLGVAVARLERQFGPQ